MRMDEDMQAWSNNLTQFTSGKITRGQYLNNAVIIEQMTIAEADTERQRYKKKNMPLDGYCKATLTSNPEPF